MADERRAARIAVLVGGGRVEVGGWSPEAGQWAVEGRVTGAGAGAGAAVQRTRKDRVAQLDLLDDDRAHVVLGLHAPGLGVGGVGGSALQVLELALRQVNRQVSKLLLELRAPLVRPLQVVEPEPAPRLVPLNLLLELRVKLVLLDRTPLCSEAACWPFAQADWFRINLGDETKPRRYYFKSLRGVSSCV